VLTPLHAKGVPEIVVEIGSKGTRKRDETIKRRLYDRSRACSETNDRLRFARWLHVQRCGEASP
jgi:hypothetical protein